MQQKKFLQGPILLFSAVWTNLIFAQGFQAVFPGLSGQELKDSIAAHYRPGVVLDYANARDTLYAKVLAVDDDSLRCIYSGHTLYLDPTQDPTQYIFQGGGPNGMNTEHAYPQNKGASIGNPRSDMHHLFPTRIPVNEARASLPFLDVADASTLKWFKGNTVLTSIPSAGKDKYSEQGSVAFEPRESVKGDIARAVFYFYSVYKPEADAADPAFFGIQRPTLCQWDIQDPADSAELVKTWRIAPYQEGKPNPFILDCTLAYRSWCSDYSASCVSAARTPLAAPLDVLVSPQPSSGPVRLNTFLPYSGELQIRLLSSTGAVEVILFEGRVSAGEFSVEFSPRSGGGLSFIEVLLNTSERRIRAVKPILTTD